MKRMTYSELDGKSRGFYALLAGLGAIIAIALGAAYYMEHHGHYVTGMNNQVVWGMPHVFAIFLIVAASGALNIASIGTVFKRKIYQPLGRLSGIFAIALLIGGLTVLVLDLGRPDRLIIAMTTYNFKSIFAWNIILYNGFIAVVAVYLWFMMERQMKKYYLYAGTLAFIWRLILTTGTGSIFGFLVARHAYDAAILAPMFIIMSFAFGLAAFILLLIPAYQWSNRALGDGVLLRLKSLLSLFIAAVFFFTVIYHLTNLYITQHHDYEHFILISGGVYTLLFWLGHIILGLLVPFALLYLPLGQTRQGMLITSGLVVLGGFAQLYVIIIGGQAFPIEVFPNKEIIATGFFDGAVGQYSPSLPEFLLGLGGVAVALVMTVLAARVLPFMPDSLADQYIDPHAK
jgi:molybdopterin-containing oxidoreductase family membrane subunit